jgi:sugar diacid utilization regulator
VAVNFVDDEKDVLKTHEMKYSLTILENGEIMRDDKNQNIKAELEEHVKKVGDRFRFYEDHEINVCIEDLKETTHIRAEDYVMVFIFKNEKEKIVAWTFANFLKPDHNLSLG